MTQSWPHVALGEVLAPVVREQKVDAGTEYRLLGVRLEGQGPFHRETVLGTETSASRLYQVKTGDFIYSRLFAWRGAFGLIGPDLDGFFVSNEFPTFAPINDQIDPKYLRYWFRLPDVLRRVEADCSGSTPLTRNRYKEQYFLALHVPLPPLDEQRRMVARVEALAAKVEEARHLRDSLRAESSASMLAMIDAFAGGAWPSVELQSVCDPERPITYGIVQAGDHVPNGVPYIRVSDMAKPQLTSVGMLRTAEWIARKYARSAVKQGDIVFAIRATVGKMRFVPPELDGANLTQGTARLAPSSKILGRFLFWALQTRGARDAIDAACKGSTFREITLGRLRVIKVPLPPLAEQQRVVNALDALQAKVDEARALQSETAAELDAMVPAILDKAFKGEL